MSYSLKVASTFNFPHCGHQNRLLNANINSVWYVCHLNISHTVIAPDNKIHCVSIGHDTFTIKHNSTGKCLLVENGLLRLGDCSPLPAASWKWGLAHRLFNVESSKCLGLEVRSKKVTLSSCTSTEMLRWRCYDDIIYTEYQMKLSALPDGTVTAKRDAQDAWKRGGTSENICQQPYRRMTHLTAFAH